MSFLSYRSIFALQQTVLPQKLSVRKAAFWTCVFLTGSALLGFQSNCLTNYFYTFPHQFALQVVLNFGDTANRRTFDVSLCNPVQFGFDQAKFSGKISRNCSDETKISVDPSSIETTSSTPLNALQCQIKCQYWEPFCFTGLPHSDFVREDYRNFTEALQFCRGLGGSLPSLNATAIQQWAKFIWKNFDSTWLWMDYFCSTDFNQTYHGIWIDSYGRIAPSRFVAFSDPDDSSDANTTALIVGTSEGRYYFSYEPTYTIRKSVCMCHCPSLQAPLNGFIIGSAYSDVTATVSFGCKKGYVLSSTGIVTCMYNGAGVDWSEVPTCLANCSQIAVPSDPNLQVSYADPNRLSGTTMHFSCQNDLLIYGRDFSTCYNGSWDITLADYPICSDILLPLLINSSQILQLLNITDVPNQISSATQLNSFMPYILSGVTYTQMLSVGFSQHDIIAYCSFNHIVCNWESIVPVLDPENGMCYTVNDKSLLSQSAMNSTSSYGLRLLLDTLSSEYFSFVTSNGIKVYIHDQNDPVFHGHPGFVLSPGLSYSILLQKEMRVKTNKPIGSCVADSTAVKYYNFNHNTNYFEGACSDSYIQAQINAQCGCNAPTLPSNGTRIPNCGVFQYACVQRLYADMHNSFILEAAKHCPSACRSATYKRTTTVSLFKKAMVGNIKGINNLNDLIELSIHHSNMRIVTWTEVVSYTVVDLISDLGSSMCLLVGMSIISWMKLVWLVVGWAKWQIAKKH